jgi:alpha-L-fucosidase
VGANYLLNIGPTGAGGIPAYETALVRKVGDWIQLHGDLIYEGVPVNVNCQGSDFVLRRGGRYYYFAHDLAREGDANVMAKTSNCTEPRVVDGFEALITSVRWLDNGAAGRFTQSENCARLALDCSGYDYGNDLVVRVAELETSA